MTEVYEISCKKYANLIKSCSYLSVIVATAILLAKIYGWFATNSVALLASLLDSMLDITSSIINVIAIRIALLPPDDNHRFGHNKTQDLAIFGQSLLFFCSSGFTIFSCVLRLLHPRSITNLEVGTAVMIFSTVLTCILVSYQTYVYNRTKNGVIEADKLHYLVDLLTNVSVIISIQLSSFWWFIDSIFGIIISMYLFYGSVRLFKRSTKNLIDHEFDSCERQKILDIIRPYQEILGVHDLKTRYAGNKAFIQCHLEMDGHMILLETHRISDLIQHEIERQFPGCEVIIHQDPAGYEKVVMYPEKL